MNNAIDEIMEKIKKLNDKIIKTNIKEILVKNEKCVKCDVISKFSEMANDILKQKDNPEEYPEKIVDMLFELVLIGEIQRISKKKIKKRKVMLGDLKEEIEKNFMKRIEKYRSKNCDCEVCKPKNTNNLENEDDYIE